jgi:Zn-dependent M28 family amino/carboxypeptidase
MEVDYCIRVKRFILIAGMLASACSSTPASAPQGASTVPAQQVPIGQLPEIDTNAVLAHTKVLSSNEYEGRGPGTKGEELSVRYIEEQFKKIGLQPGNTDGTYIQKVPLVGITAAPANLTFAKGKQTQTLKWKDDVVAWTKHVADTAAIHDSELVFVGYGVVAPEFNWDDYKDVDVTGKTLVMLVNDPPVEGAFGGKAMTYYGRWTYKYEIGAQKKAAAVLIVHETGPAGYPFEVVQSKVTEQFDLVTPDKNMARVNVEGWITLDKTKDLFTLAGQDFDALKAQAATREFKPVPLGVTASMTLHNKLRTIDSRNVIGKLAGADPKLKDEYVVYSAHWDHFGIGPEVNGDRIYHGAQDNAIGVAGMIEVARAFTQVQPPPKRSILFLSVTAEEQGLLGSQYYATLPIYPLAKTVADINIDAANVHGRTKDLVLVGFGASDLDDYAAAAAAEQGRVVKPDAEPEKGFYYRSDHFNFAKQGVPALDPDAGVDYVGKPADYGAKVRDDYTEHRYHKPQDVVRPDWDLSGEREDLRVYFAIGYRVANADNMPQWKPGTEFKAKRDAMLKSKTEN